MTEIGHFEREISVFHYYFSPYEPEAFSNVERKYEWTITPDGII